VVKLDAYKQTGSGGNSTLMPLYLRAQVVNAATGRGVAGAVVTVQVSYVQRGLLVTDTVRLPATSSSGFALSCGGKRFPINAALSLSVNPVTNPGGGPPARGLPSVPVTTSGMRNFCN